MAEARRLWDLEVGQARITTVQAAAIISLHTGEDTLDAVFETYLQQAMRIAQSLGLFGSLAHIPSRSRRKVYTVTAWGLYGYQG